MDGSTNTTARPADSDESEVATPARRFRRSLAWRMGLRRIKRAYLRARSRAVSSEDVPVVVSQPARVGLVLVTSTYIALFSFWSLRQHYGFATFGFDLGIFEQGMWLLSRGKEPFVTVLGLNLFGDHSSFFLLALVPFYWVSSSTSMLLLAQSLALGLGAWPAFLLAREKLRHEVAALGVAVAYLAHPAIGLTNLENFHPDSFEVPLLLGAIYFMVQRRWRGYAICIAAILLIKEDVPLLTFTLGIYVALRYDRRVGIITSLVSVAWFAAVLLIIFPALNGVGTLDAWRLPSNQFGGIGGLLRATFTRPWEVAQIALGPERPWYLWQMFFPFALLSLLSPSLFLVAIGPLMSNLLSTFWYQYQIGYHYGTLIVPVLVAAAVFGIAKFRPPYRFQLVGIMLAAALVSAYLWGPLGRHTPAIADPNSEHAQAVRAAIEVIPEEAAVSAVYYTVPHLAHREHIYEFPVPWRAQNWGDFSQEGERLPEADLIDYVLVPQDQAPHLQRTVDSLDKEGFELIYHEDGMMVLERQVE